MHFWSAAMPSSLRRSRESTTSRGMASHLSPRSARRMRSRSAAPAGLSRNWSARRQPVTALARADPVSRRERREILVPSGRIEHRGHVEGRRVERLIRLRVGEADAIAQQAPGFPGEAVQRLLPAAVLDGQRSPGIPIELLVRGGCRKGRTGEANECQAGRDGTSHELLLGLGRCLGRKEGQDLGEPGTRDEHDQRARTGHDAAEILQNRPGSEATVSTVPVPLGRIPD